MQIQVQRFLSQGSNPLFASSPLQHRWWCGSNEPQISVEQTKDKDICNSNVFSDYQSSSAWREITNKHDHNKFSNTLKQVEMQCIDKMAIIVNMCWSKLLPLNIDLCRSPQDGSGSQKRRTPRTPEIDTRGHACFASLFPQCLSLFATGSHSCSRTSSLKSHQGRECSQTSGIKPQINTHQFMITHIPMTFNYHHTLH